MAFLSFNDQFSMSQDISKDTSASTLLTFKREINNGSGILFHQLNRYIYEETFTQLTVASQQGYELPNHMIRLSSVTVTSGNIPYVTTEITNREEWLALNQVNTATSTYPEFHFIDKDKVYFFPVPVSTGLTITLVGEVRLKEMTQADYTTGNVTVTNGSKNVVGVGTAWDGTFVGRFIQTTNDGYWYKIASVTDTTHLTLQKAFEGTTGSTQAYTIGEQVLGAYEDLHLLPVWFALWQFYNIRRDSIESPKYQELWITGLNQAKLTYNKRSSSNVIPNPKSLPQRWPYGQSNQFPSVPYP